MPSASGKLLVMEAKAARSVKPVMGVSLNKLARAISRYQIEKYLVHLNSPDKAKKEFHTFSPGIKAIPVSEIGKYC